MKVSSPIGDFPFEARRLTLAGRVLVVEGSMGAWPARIEIASNDIPRLLRLIPAPVLAAGVFLVLGPLVRAFAPAKSRRD
jgi:hypothetical protein